MMFERHCVLNLSMSASSVESRRCLPTSATGPTPEPNIGHAISLKDGITPSYWSVYRLSPAKKERYLCNRWIQPSKSPFGVTILFVKKTHNTPCMCVDYCTLNKAKVKYRCPMPHILVDDLFDKIQVQGAKCFWIFDLAEGHH